MHHSPALICVHFHGCSTLQQWYRAAIDQGHFEPLRPRRLEDSVAQLTSMVFQLAQSVCSGQPAAFLGSTLGQMDLSQCHRAPQTPQQARHEWERQQAALAQLQAAAAVAAADGGAAADALVTGVPLSEHSSVTHRIKTA